MKEIPSDLGPGPFTLAHAAELGLSPRVLDGPRFRAPLSGVRTLRSAPDTVLTRCAAAALVIPSYAVFSHETALHLGSWLTPHQGDGAARYSAREPPATTPIHVTVPRDSPRPQRRGIIAHRSDLGTGDVIDLDGLRITSPWRTWADLAAGGSELDLVILADALRRRFGGGATRLEARLAEMDGRRGSQALRGPRSNACGRP